MFRTSNKKKKSKNEGLKNLERSVRSTKLIRIMKEVWSFIIAFILVFAFRSTFYEPFHIPSGSMVPTLNIGDFVLVNKFAYGFKIPYSDMGTKPIYFTKSKMPKKGEVFIFKYPENPKVNFIKRVMAVPGDTIEIVEGVIFINDEPLIRKEVESETKDKLISTMVRRFREMEWDIYYETNGDVTYLIQQVKNHPNWPRNTRNMPKMLIPENTFFAMGDNRDFSEDSRFWGFVPFHYVKGRAMFVWLSLSIPGLDDTDEWIFRGKRIGTKIK